MLMKRHGFIDEYKYNKLYTFSENLSAKILAIRKAIKKRSSNN